MTGLAISKSNDRAIFAQSITTSGKKPLSASSKPPALQGQPAPVGVFDSGVGGLSIWPALQARLPGVPLCYVADSGHAPYGEKSSPFVQDRSLFIVDFLAAQGARTVVVACNTATAVAIPLLRSNFPQLTVVGMEPAIKPAAALTRCGRIGVMATTRTLQSERYAQLRERHAQGLEVLDLSCPGLALAIEQGDLATVDRLLQQHSLTLREAQVDVVVLGCTHYPFVRDRLQALLGPAVTVLDTAEAVARRVAEVGAPPMGTGSAGRAPDRFWTSGQPQHLEDFAQRWLGLAVSAAALPRASEPASAAAAPTQKTPPC